MAAVIYCKQQYVNLVVHISNILTHDCGCCRRLLRMHATTTKKEKRREYTIVWIRFMSLSVIILKNSENYILWPEFKIVYDHHVCIVFQWMHITNQNIWRTKRMYIMIIMLIRFTDSNKILLHHVKVIRFECATSRNLITTRQIYMLILPSMQSKPHIFVKALILHFANTIVKHFILPTDTILLYWQSIMYITFLAGVLQKSIQMYNCIRSPYYNMGLCK